MNEKKKRKNNRIIAFIALHSQTRKICSMSVSYLFHYVKNEKENRNEQQQQNEVKRTKIICKWFHVNISACNVTVSFHFDVIYFRFFMFLHCRRLFIKIKVKTSHLFLFQVFVGFIYKYSWRKCKSKHFSWFL